MGEEASRWFSSHILVKAIRVSVRIEENWRSLFLQTYASKCDAGFAWDFAGPR
jgi:hypothetical protein